MGCCRLSVRPLVDGGGAETGKYAVTAGGWRLAALKLLVKQKRLAKNAPVPCIVKTDGVEEEDFLAENTMREALHPLDQFRAFKNLHDQGLSIDDIAARFFVGAQVVRQRLKLAAASPKLLDLYVAEELSLDQLMAFCVTDDHARQQEVWEALSRSYDKGPYAIRRQLTQGAVRASDKRALFVGVETYETAGGVVLRDLFNRDDGGWPQDAALLDRLAARSSSGPPKKSALKVGSGPRPRSISPTATSLACGGCRGPKRRSRKKTDTIRRRACRIHSPSDEHESADELPEDVDQRMAELEAEIAAVDERPSIYARAEIARAGVFVSIDHDGRLKFERGFVRPEDEARREGGAPAAAGEPRCGAQSGADDATVGAGLGADPTSSELTEEEVETSPKLSGLLVLELSAHRTVAMRLGLASNPQAAFLAATHALALNAFYSASSHSCLDLSERSGRSDRTPRGSATISRRGPCSTSEWHTCLPADPADLRSWLLAQDESVRADSSRSASGSASTL